MKQKLIHMRMLIQQVDRAARIVNQPLLVKKKMTEKDTRILYNCVKHLFLFPSAEKKDCWYETIPWKSYHNVLVKQRWQLYGEKRDKVPAEQDKVEQVVKNNQQRKQRKNPQPSTSKKRQQRTKTQQQTKSKLPSTKEITVEDDIEILNSIKAVPEPTNKCCLGAECTHPQVPVTFVCKARGCMQHINHICAYDKGWTGYDEIDVYCSVPCMMADRH